MPTRHRRRSRFAFVVLPLVLILVAGYFAWQSTRGTFDQETRQALRSERQDREMLLASLIAERERLEDRVRRLRSGALDADLLDERARAKLNMALPNEIVILHSPAAAPVAALAAHGR